MRGGRRQGQEPVISTSSDQLRKVRILVDGVAVLEPPFDASDASGSLVGLWCAQVRLVVSGFAVLKLPQRAPP